MKILMSCKLFSHRIKAISIFELWSNVLIKIVFGVIIATLILWLWLYIKNKYNEQKTIGTYTKFLLDIQQKSLSN